jgi:hypothetical protein
MSPQSELIVQLHVGALNSRTVRDDEVHRAVPALAGDAPELSSQ